MQHANLAHGSALKKQFKGLLLYPTAVIRGVAVVGIDGYGHEYIERDLAVF